VIAFLDTQLAEMFQEIHDVGAIVHVVSLQLFQDTGVEVFVHVAMFEGILGAADGGGAGGGEVGEEVCES